MENKTCLKPPSPAMVDASFLPWLSGIGSLNGVKHSRCCDGICMYLCCGTHFTAVWMDAVADPLWGWVSCQCSWLFCYSVWSKKVWKCMKFHMKSQQKCANRNLKFTWRANRNAKSLNLKTQQEPGFSQGFFLKRPRCLEGSFCETGNLLILENRWVLEARKTLKSIFLKKKTTKSINHIYMIFFGGTKKKHWDSK